MSVEPAITPIIDTTVPGHDFQSLTEKYEDLNKKYLDLSQKAKYLEKKNASVMQKNKDMKENVRAWQEYADRQAEKQKHKHGHKLDDARVRMLIGDRPIIPSSPVSIAALGTPALSPHHQRSSSTPIAPLSQPVADTTAAQEASVHVRADSRSSLDSPGLDQTPQLPIESGSPHNEALLHVPLPSAHPNSSQTTVDEFFEQTNTDALMSDPAGEDDFPQVVSERNLKRKRSQPSRSRFEIYAEQDSTEPSIRPCRIKEEQCSSPPPINKRLMRTETFDLDIPTPKILQTPRQNRTNFLMNPNLTVKEECRRLDPQTNSGLPSPKVAIAETRSPSEPFGAASDDEGALQPLDLNLVTNSPNETPSKRSRESRIRRGKGDVPSIESCENLTPDNEEPRSPLPPTRANIDQHMLTSKSPQLPAMTAVDTPHPMPSAIKAEQLETPPMSSSRLQNKSASAIDNHARKSESRSSRRDDPIPSGPIWTMSALSEPRSSAQRARASSSKKARQLKDRPLTELTLQDFKPNPTYNQGYTYAFSETVRNRADRLCLPGCTNPQCCGSTFRILVEAQAPLSASQEENLLEEYLGNAYDEVNLAQMSSGERKELVLQARTEKMAKQTGKHREAYERRKTPPGFWRVDFPTTQEQQDDRERAKEQQRAEVQQRWLEAQRKGGRWIFRDQ